MKISHKLVASSVGVSLLRSVVGAVAIADNACGILETVRSIFFHHETHRQRYWYGLIYQLQNMLSSELRTRNGLNTPLPLTELFRPMLHTLFSKLHRIFRKKNFQQGYERAKVLLRCNC
ncbi:MAG: hypothetical protein RMY16_03775 [Nostoc sp. DedQUE12b]|uniref:hypothetical protein n=1 Tax=Nostoc sp. DedQUE12b TaxID=3075398 RepID=UPI002AD3C75D|nr:hypothetical protein [Nostoc sp. DedQUE12b]MDZ8084704.1 hypothetical protein [Nostoc sp. DedQUE12b]